MASDGSDCEDGGHVKAPAMTPYEKQVLLDLVDEFKTILESKSTNFGTTTQKASAWKTVTERFCSTLDTTRRTEEQLKTWWSNCKKRAKKHAAKNKYSLTKTGGGKAKHRSDMELDRVTGIIPGQMISLDNPFDDDAELSNVQDENEGNEIDQPPKKKMKPLEQESRKQKDARSSLTDMEYEEHRLRMKILATELETAGILKTKAEQEVKNLGEEHKLRITLANAQINQARGFQLPINNDD